MEQLALFNEEQLALFDNCVAKEGVSLMPKNKVEVITPLPLSDLLFMIDFVNEGGCYSKKAKGLEALGSGAFGTVLGYKNYAIKYLRNGSSCYESSNFFEEEDSVSDVYFLKRLQSVKAIPRLYAVIDDIAIVIERIHGETVHDYMENPKRRFFEPEHNYISPNFNEEFEESLKDILHLGFYPHDLHSQNVMVCRNTGLPKIVDVGLFEKIQSQRKLELAKDRDNINFHRFAGAEDAMIWIAYAIAEFVKRKKYPERYKEEDMKKMIEHAEREAHRENARRDKEKIDNFRLGVHKEHIKVDGKMETKYIDKFINKPLKHRA